MCAFRVCLGNFNVVNFFFQENNISVNFICEMRKKFSSLLNFTFFYTDTYVIFLSENTGIIYIDAFKICNENT